MAPREFTRLIDRFHQKASYILIHSDALVEKLVGDQLAGLYVPGYAGQDYAKRALEAALKLQAVARREMEDGSGVPFGIGVHNGRAFVGAVGARESIIEITALGDDVNTAARLCQMAGSGELVVSDTLFEAAGGVNGHNVTVSEPKNVPIKGREAGVTMRVIELI
jgi:adenylate cyclase